MESGWLCAYHHLNHSQFRMSYSQEETLSALAVYLRELIAAVEADLAAKGGDAELRRILIRMKVELDDTNVRLASIAPRLAS